MTGQTTTERILDAYLAPEADRLPDRVIEAALADIARTPQRRALRVPWRFPTMPALSRATGIAAVALVAVVGAGGIIYLSTPGGGGGGNAGSPTPPSTPIPSAAPTPTAAPTATPAPSEIAPGILGFTPYTSAVYGITFGYPDDWTQCAEATLEWQEGIDPDAPFTEEFCGPDEGGVAFAVWQVSAGSGADLTSHDGLAEWVAANDREPHGIIPLCVDKAACAPAILLAGSDTNPDDTIPAYIADPDAGTVTIVLLGRSDDHPTTARYGGGIQLLRSILTTFDVWTPEPGQIPG